MMTRHLLPAAAGIALIATSANAGIGPPIAYVKASGTAQEIYLVNPDGSALTKLYTAPRKMVVGNLDLKPGGGEIAFSLSGDLKILSYDELGRPTASLRSIDFPCANETVAEKDYHPSGTLVVTVICGSGIGESSLWQLGSGSSTPELLVPGPHTAAPRFLPGGNSFIYKTGLLNVEAEKLWKDSWPPSGSPVLVGSTPPNPRVNVANTTDTAIVTSWPNYLLVNANTGAQTTGCVQVRNVQYSPDDSQMLYLNINNRGGSDTLIIWNSDCSGSQYRLTGKGSWAPTFDWRGE